MAENYQCAPSSDKNNEEEIVLITQIKSGPGIHPKRTKEKSKKNKTQDSTVPYWRLYRYASITEWINIWIAVLCMTVVGACQPYFCIALGTASEYFILYVSQNSTTNAEEQAAQDKLYSDIHYVFITCICLGSATFICQYLSGILFSYSSLQQVFKIRQRFLEKTLYQDISWYDLNKSGDFATTFSENLAKLEEGMGDKVGICLYYQVAFLVGIVWSFILGWKLAIVCFLSLPASILMTAFITRLSTKYTKQEMESYSKAGAIAEEVFSSIRTVVAFDGQKKEMERYDVHLVDAKNNNIKRNLFSGFSNGSLWFFVYACCALSMFYGVKLIIDEKNLPQDQITYTPGVVVSIFFNSLMSTWNFCSGAPYFQIFGVACGAAAKVFKVLDSEPVINLSLKMGAKLKKLKGEISFDNICFNYPSRPDVQILNNLSLTIKPGETVAFVGSSGCGKSTCIQLVQRFFDPTAGEITIDGIDMKDLNLSWLRSKIGVVGQEPTLFANTIAENIRYGKFSASEKEIEEAAKKANAHNFIKNLPNGYETVIGERGTQLSGGQKQRIAIARALIRNPPILLLDEATSALDTTSEAEVQAALDSASGERTTIIIAHRLSTVRNANRIFVFSAGQVVEEGSYHELIAKEGEFYNLVKSQGMTGEETTNEVSEIVEPVINSIADPEKRHSYVDVDQYKHRQSISESDLKQEKTFFGILKMNRPELPWILLACAASILIGAALPVFSILFGDIIGVLSYGDDQQLAMASELICLFFLILGVVTGLAFVIQIYAFGVAGENLTLRIRSKVFATMLKQEIGWFDKKENAVGALCSKLSSDAAAVQGASGMAIGVALSSFSTLILADVLALYFQWKLALVMLAFFPFIFISVYFENQMMGQAAETKDRKLQKSASLAVEAISNIRTVASLGCEQLFTDRYTEELIPYIASSKRKSHFKAAIMGLVRSLMFFAYATGLRYGADLVVDENMNYGTVFKVAELVITGSWALGHTFAFMPNFQAGLQSAGRILTLLRRIPEIANIPNAVKREKEVGQIQYSKVYFSYPTRPDLPVLKGLDLAITAGKTIALVGSSGDGKSTVVQLLERFYNPTSGAICMDDTDIKQMDLHNLRAHFGIVSQEPNLFDRTIAENIAYGDSQRDIPMDEIVEAAKKANIHNFVTALPQGYETSLGKQGSQLSGGQKQRIAIARALIRNPKILLLDEATSALDNESEKVVQEALDKAKEGRTCITIAHRLTTIQDADVICVLKKGRVVEMGKHQELIEKRGLYYSFYKLQCNH